MRKPKERADDHGHEAHFFDDFEIGEGLDDSDDESGARDARKAKKQPARQRVELRHEQLTLRKQLSDWDDYDQDEPAAKH